jgi:hypothetical protein
MSSGSPPYYPDLESAIHGTQAPPEVIERLELVPVDFVNFDFERKTGQLVVASALASDVQEIFGEIRDAEFPIFSIIPIAWFGHDDLVSIGNNNTSGFCYRPVWGTNVLSKHALGNAVDVNPLFNPYEAGGFPYNGYDPNVLGTIVEGGVVVRAFLGHGWEWGGRWARGERDYQHFNKD